MLFTEVVPSSDPRAMTNKILQVEEDQNHKSSETRNVQSHLEITYPCKWKCLPRSFCIYYKVHKEWPKEVQSLLPYWWSLG